jgi:hypothetical protein
LYPWRNRFLLKHPHKLLKSGKNSAPPTWFSGENHHLSKDCNFPYPYLVGSRRVYVDCEDGRKTIHQKSWISIFIHEMLQPSLVPAFEVVEVSMVCNRRLIGRNHLGIMGWSPPSTSALGCAMRQWLPPVRNMIFDIQIFTFFLHLIWCVYINIYITNTYYIYIYYYYCYYYYIVFIYLFIYFQYDMKNLRNYNPLQGPLQ